MRCYFVVTAYVRSLNKGNEGTAAIEEDHNRFGKHYNDGADEYSTCLCPALLFFSF